MECTYGTTRGRPGLDHQQQQKISTAQTPILKTSVSPPSSVMGGIASSQIEESVKYVQYVARTWSSVRSQHTRWQNRTTTQGCKFCRTARAKGRGALVPYSRSPPLACVCAALGSSASTGCISRNKLLISCSNWALPEARPGVKPKIKFLPLALESIVTSLFLPVLSLQLLEQFSVKHSGCGR